MRVKYLASLPALLLAMLTGLAPQARAEYFVLQSGQRLHVSGYQLLGDKYRLQMQGGFVELAAQDVTGIEPEDVFTSAPPVTAAKAPFRDLIESAAARYSVDADLITSVIAAESNFNPRAISRRNARGLMQLLPPTASRMGVKNIFDPKENVDGGTRYLRTMLTRYHNDVTLALAAYNAGPEKVEQYGNRVPPYQETQQYIERIARGYAKIRAKGYAPSRGPATAPAEVSQALEGGR